MRILGIDPGYAIVGYGVVDASLKKEMTLCTYGCIRTGKEDPAHIRLQSIYHAMMELITRSEPYCMAIEQLFFSRNTTTALQVSEARGVILLAAAECSLGVFEYRPNQIKQAVTGSGNADKKQVQKMITRLLGMSAVPRPDDAADALATAVCHLHYTQRDLLQ